MQPALLLHTCMTSLNDSAMRNMPGTAPLLLLLLSGQPVSFLKLLRRFGQIAVGVDMLTCAHTNQTRQGMSGAERSCTLCALMHQPAYGSHCEPSTILLHA